MSSNHEDQNARELEEAKLTAYVLDQLDDHERAEVEGMLARSEKSRQFVEETTRWAEQIRAAYQSSPMPEPSKTLRETLEEELQKTAQSQLKGNEMNKPTNRKRSLKRYLIGLTLVGGIATVLVALLIPALQPAKESASKSEDKSPQIAQVPKNERIRNEADSDKREKRDKAEDKLAVMCDEFNRLVDEQRYEEAQAIGKKAAELFPKDTVARKMFLTAKLLYRVKNNERMKGLAQKSFLDTLESVEESKVPFDDRAPYIMPDAKQWESPRWSWKRNLAADITFVPQKESYGYVIPQFGGYATGGKPSELELQSPSKQSIDTSGPAPNTEQYDPIHDNAFLPVAEQPLSTFSIDVDTASYANIRRFLREGCLPPPNAVRIEEMINYFPYDYSPPTGGTPFAVNMETAQCPWKPEHRLLRIGLKGREIDRKNRGASNLVFLLDVSGSMGEADKLPLVKEAMKMLVAQLTEDDRVAIVTYASDTRVQLASARGNQREQITAAIDALQAGGCTYGSGGIQLAYEQAADHFVKGGVNRVILCTDGDLNVGVTQDEDLVQLIEAKAKSGVFLTVLGFGTGNLKDSKMQKLADKGNGIYAYIDGMREARRVLVEQMTGSLITIAKDVKIQIEFNPAVVRAYRLIGYEKRLLENRDFNDDKKDAGEIGAGHTVTALYELMTTSSDSDTPEAAGLKYQKQKVAKTDLTPQAENGELLTLKIRYKEPEGDTSKLLEFTTKDSGERFGKATADFRFATSVAAFGMVLRSSPYRGDLNYAAAAEYAAGSLGSDPSGYRAEFLDLIRQAGKIAPNER